MQTFIREPDLLNWFWLLDTDLDMVYSFTLATYILHVLRKNWSVRIKLASVARVQYSLAGALNRAACLFEVCLSLTLINGALLIYLVLVYYANCIRLH